jgi:hypothetical protein
MRSAAYAPNLWAGATRHPSADRRRQAGLAEDLRVVPSSKISARNPTASSRIIPENDEGRTVVGFDASRAMQQLDGSRALRELDAQRYSIVPSHIASANNILRQYQKTVLGFSGIDEIQRSIQGSMARSIGSLSSAAMNRAGAYSHLTKVVNETLRPYKPPIHHQVIPESVRRGLPGLTWNLAGSSYYARMQSDVLKQVRMPGYLGLSRSIAQAFKSHGLDSAYSAAWSLRHVQSFRTPALQSMLKTATTFGPIVVSPDYEDAPFDYHPNLQGWLIPETATESGDAIDVEELWAEVVAFAVGIAQHHHSKVLLRVMREDGRSFLIQVASTVLGGLILYWILYR